MVRYGLIFFTTAVMESSSPARQYPVDRVIGRLHTIYQAAARCTFTRGQPQKKIIVILRRLETEIVEVPGAIDGCYINERYQVAVRLDEARNHDGFVELVRAECAFACAWAAVYEAAHQQWPGRWMIRRRSGRSPVP